MLGRSIILTVALASCSLLPQSRISQDQAVVVARDRVELANAVVVSAVEGQWALGDPRRAWVVTFRGGYLTCEGPGEPGSQASQPCRIADGQAVLYVDIETGEFLGGDVGGPIEVPEGR
jgi:hypothetical protein